MSTSPSIQSLLEADLDTLNACQATQLLQHLTHNDVEIKPEHLNLALRHRLFKIALQLIDKGITSPQLVNLIMCVLSCPLRAETDFEILLLHCLAAGIDLSAVLTSLNEINPVNADSAMIIITPLLFSQTDLSSIDASAAPYTIRSVVEAAKSGCLSLVYEDLKAKLIDQTETLHANKLAKLNEAQSLIDSPEISQRIRENANAIPVTCRTLALSTTQPPERFRDKVLIDMETLEKYLTENVVPPMRVITQTLTEVKMVSENTSRTISALNNFNQTNLKPFLENPSAEAAESFIEKYKTLCADYAHQRQMSSPFDYKTISLQAAAALISVFRLYLNGKAEKALNVCKEWCESCENLEEKLKSDVPRYQTSLCDPLTLRAKLNDPSTELHRSARYACDCVLLVIHFCECALLEATVKEEAAADAVTSTVYPKQYKDILKKLVRQPAKTQFASLRALRDEILEQVTDRASLLFRKILAIPGVRRDTKYVDFTPTEQWKWPQIPKYSFPSTPQEVRDVLLSRSRMKELLTEYLLSPTTEMCRQCGIGLAAIVCKDCKKIVLCEACMNSHGKCPICGRSLSYV